MSPRNKVGYALSDGEGCERLWSFMRRFSRMTREMRPAHRIDVLTDAVLHFARATTGRLSMCTYVQSNMCMIMFNLIHAETLLPERLLKAQKSLSECQGQLSELMNNSPGMH